MRMLAGPAAAGGPGGASLDPEQYAQAMSSVLGNPEFMQMAEKLGQQIMTVSIPHVKFDLL